MATTAIIPIHGGKGRPVAAALKMSINYVKNPAKTDEGQWVTAFACDPLIADDEFLFSKNQYAAITGRNQGARDVLAYHLRIAFMPGETDAETANRIGYELAAKLTHGNHAFVCCTHTDKQHVHTHVVINSTSIDCTKKFRNFKGSAFAIRKIADFLCVENGLSIVKNPQPSKGTIYAKNKGGERQPTGRDQLRTLMDENIVIGNSLTEFITKLKRAGVEVKHGKQFSFRPPGSKRFFRQDSLGEDYSEDAIRERLMGTREAPQRQPADEVFIPFVITRETKFGLLIDIQKKVQEGKGEAYENWARLYNLKQLARTLIYLQENGIDSYDELVQKSSAASAEFNGKLKRIKEIEVRQKEISELQYNIGHYGKSRVVYKVYRNIKSQKDRDIFFEANRADITLHLAAKKYFDGLGLKKLPSMQSLRQEYATLESERKSLYRGYHEMKDQRTAWQTAKDNCERILGIGKAESEHVTTRVPKRHHSYEL